MKLVSFSTPSGPEAGLYHEGRVMPLARGAWVAEKKIFPRTMEALVEHWDAYGPMAEKLHRRMLSGDLVELSVENAVLTAPLPRPASCRDAYAFRQHVFTARRNRGVPMIPEFDMYPVFYFTNHHAVTGPGKVLCQKDHFVQLDFELEVAVIVARRGRNIEAKHADDYILGYTIMNDWSARTLQMEEMLLNLGPAKGKDFATSIGPWIVTPDELADKLVTPKPGHEGRAFDLAMTARVNGVQVSAGNLADMDWTFAEILERCAYGADLFPGDVIGSGTVGTGCFLELNGSAKLENPDFVPQWLRPGDEVELSVERLGVLNNIPVLESEFSILAKKKSVG
jgi:fumarylacetoacetate (FAA) hydrolase